MDSDADLDLFRCVRRVLMPEGYFLPDSTIEVIRGRLGFHDLRSAENRYYSEEDGCYVEELESDAFDHIPLGQVAPILADLRPGGDGFTFLNCP